MSKCTLPVCVYLLSNCGFLFAAEPKELLKRAHSNLQTLSSSCAVVSHLEYSRVSAIPEDNVGRSEQRQALIFDTLTNARNRLELFSVRHEGKFQVKQSPFEGLPSTIEAWEIVARSGDDWWAKSGTGSENPVLRLIEPDQRPPDDAKALRKQLSAARFELAAMPLLTFWSLSESEVTFEASKAAFNPLNKNCFIYHSSEPSPTNDGKAGLWTNSNGSGLIKIEFTEACNWLPTVFEYYARDPNVPFKEGASKGLLTYRTATTWSKASTHGTKLCPTFIVLEIFSDNQYKTITISAAWKIDLKRSDFSEDCIIQPAGDNSLGNLFHELTESLATMRKKQAVSASTKSR